MHAYAYIHEYMCTCMIESDTCVHIDLYRSRPPDGLYIYVFNFVRFPRKLGAPSPSGGKGVCRTFSEKKTLGYIYIVVHIDLCMHGARTRARVHARMYVTINYNFNFIKH